MKVKDHAAATPPSQSAKSQGEDSTAKDFGRPIRRSTPRLAFDNALKIAKNWRLPLRFARTVVQRGYLPLNLDLHITKICNLECSFCYADLSSMRRVKDPTLSEIEDIIDQAFDMGVRWIRLLGGEPLVRKDVGTIIRYIKKKGIFCEVNTNATMIPRKLKELEAVDAICISVDGPREANDKVRGKGSFDQIVAGLEAAISAGHTPRLHAVLTRHNKDTIEEFAEFAKKYGCRFNYNHCALENYPDPAFDLSKEESAEFCQNILNAKAKGYKISNSKKCVELMSQWPVDENVITYDAVKRDPKLAKMFPECQMAYKAVYLDVDGMVYACPRRWKHGINYKDVGLEKAWRHVVETRPCYVCKEMAIIERGLIFGGNIPAITNAFFGFA